ncbi:MAG: hypothetical protein ACR2PC_02625 [Tsuneonella suprasediminis]|nr:hypothetical protein LBX01_00990 [Altererythrobacter sp. N1]
MTFKPALLALPFLALLAACGDKDSAGASAERQTAAGEVLPGTISDEMLPLDSVKSQSPPMKDSPSDKGGTKPDGDSAATAEADGDAADAPAAAPSASPSAAAAAAAAPEPGISLGDRATRED